MNQRTKAERKLDTLNQELRTLLKVPAPNNMVRRRIDRLQAVEIPSARNAVQRVRDR